MDDSILTSIKKALGISEDYEVFDSELVLFINSTLSNLQQLGVGPVEGFSIQDKSTKWSALLDDELRLNNAKSLVFLKTKLLFDPPGTPHLLNAYEEQIREQEWRLTVTDSELTRQQPLVLDGGAP